MGLNRLEWTESGWNLREESGIGWNVGIGSNKLEEPGIGWIKIK